MLSIALDSVRVSLGSGYMSAEAATGQCRGGEITHTLTENNAEAQTLVSRSHKSDPGEGELGWL